MVTKREENLVWSSSSCFTVGNWDPQESWPWIPSWRSLRVQIQASQSQG